MSYLDAVLIAKARTERRGQRSAMFRHCHLVDEPMGLLLWQLGAEPFTAAAIAWGFGPSTYSLAVPGEPRDRELAFRALLQLARGFNSWFEKSVQEERAQVIVPNRGNLTLLGRLGRRLAYLRTDGDRPADPALVRLGLHLRFLADHARTPGQQLVVALTDLLSSHWVTEFSMLEMQHLPAVDAAIAPPRGRSGSEAAALAESLEIGPLPGGGDDDAVDVLVQKLNVVRSRRTDEATVAPLRKPIEAHYRRLVDRGWELIWRCVGRERGYREAAHVSRRWKEDVEQAQRHVAWVGERAGRYRTWQTHAQAARTLRHWEDAERLRVAEEAIDDPLRMIPVLLAGYAMEGVVVGANLEHREQGPKNMVRRPRVVLEVDHPCEGLLEKKLYWTETPAGGEYQIVDVSPRRSGTWNVTLQHQTGSPKWPHPEKGSRATFSIHHLEGSPPLMLPQSVPWSHTEPVREDVEADEAGVWE